MEISTQQTTAVVAAVRRVYAHKSRKEQDIEVAWIHSSVILDKKGYIRWRSFELGRLLLDALSEAQNWRCCYCGVRVLDVDSALITLEHIIPKSKGGDDHLDNLAIACDVCNYSRGNKDLADFL